MRSRRLGLRRAASLPARSAGWLLAQRRFTVTTGAICSAPGRSAGWPRSGFLAGQDGVETVRLLRDYLAWERQPMLRRRAEAIVRRMEATLA